MKPTQEQAKLFLPWVQALAEGKKIEIMGSDDKWHKLQENLDWFDDDDTSIKFRIKPEPQYRAWKDRTEVPIGAKIVFLNGDSGEIVAANDHSFFYMIKSIGPLCVPFGHAVTECKYFSENSETWFPCGVEVKPEEETKMPR